MNIIYDLIIIGSGPAGLSAGIYAGRAKIKTLIINEESDNEIYRSASIIEDYPGVGKISAKALKDEMRTQCSEFGVELKDELVNKVELVSNLKKVYTMDNEYVCRSIIISTGAPPARLGIPGEMEFLGKGISYSSICDGEFYTNLELFVVGSSPEAIQEALYLTRFGKSVTLIVKDSDFKKEKNIAESVLSHPKVEVRFDTELIEVRGDSVIKSAVFKNIKTGKTDEYKPADADGTFGIFILLGNKPASQVFAGKIDMDENGFIITDEALRTNKKGVYAAGDIRLKSLRQFVTAASDGAIAATAAEKYITEEKEKLGISDTSEIEEVSLTEPAVNYLDESTKSQLSYMFQKLEKDMTFVVIKDPLDEKSSDLEAFLKEISRYSDHIRIVVKEKGSNLNLEHQINADKFPVVAFLDSNSNYVGVKFHGIPVGQELNSFMLSVYNLAGPGQAISDNLIKRAQNIYKDFNIKVCVSLNCHFCPEVVVASQHLAMLNEKIEAEMIDLALFPAVKNKYQITNVPAIIINDRIVHFGAKKIDEILEILEETV